MPSPVGCTTTSVDPATRAEFFDMITSVLTDPDDAEWEQETGILRVPERTRTRLLRDSRECSRVLSVAKNQIDSRSEWADMVPFGFEYDVLVVGPYYVIHLIARDAPTAPPVLTLGAAYEMMVLRRRDLSYIGDYIVVQG